MRRSVSVLNSDEEGNGKKKLIVYRQCDWCGNKFYIRHPSLWRYKENFKSKEHYFCSWGCLSNARKNSKKKATDSGSITYGATQGTWKREEKKDDTCTT